MTSKHFQTLEGAVRDLQGVYLTGTAGAALPTAEQQEFARAFVVMAHSEIEFFMESVCLELAELAAQEGSQGRFSLVSLSLLQFSQLESLGAGDILKGKATSRTVATRMFNALEKYRTAIEENHGVREKYLAKMLVPLGIMSAGVDSTWLGDLDKFCEDRGSFAHSSRSSKKATYEAVNPADVWKRCERLVWKDPTRPTGRAINSFEEIDDWMTERTSEFATSFVAPKSGWAHVIQLLRALFGR